MKVTDSNGRVTNFPPKGYQVSLDDTRPRSKYHIKCREILRELFPLESILEEVPVPGEGLYLDFYIPGKHLIIEVNGEQHSEYSSFFHSTKANFYTAKKNDRKKIDWALANNLKIIIVDYKDMSRWVEIIKGE